MREIIAKEVISPESMRDDGSKGSYQRTRGHRLVDQSLHLSGEQLFLLVFLPLEEAISTSSPTPL